MGHSQAHPARCALCVGAEPMEALALPQCLCKSVDVGDEAAFVAAVAEGEAAHGPVEVMVNNAGCMMLSVRGHARCARLRCGD